MGKFVSNRDETIRLFQNPVLEYFSHIHPATPIVVFTPVVVGMGYWGLSLLPLVSACLSFILGIILWTFMEYAIHRWAFHYHPRSDWGKRLHFLVHGIHHAYPRDSTRLVMPLLVSIPLATAFFFLFYGLFDTYSYTLFSGFIAGYIAYDSIHYATHHFPMKNRIGKFLKHYHLRHHYNDEHTAYGISTPLWDILFRTTPIYINNTQEDNNKRKDTDTP